MGWQDSLANALVGAVVSNLFSGNKAENDNDSNIGGSISNNGSSYDYNYSSHNAQPQYYYSPRCPTPSNDYNYSSHNSQPQYYNSPSPSPPQYYYPPSPSHSNDYNYNSHTSQPQYYHSPSPGPSSSSGKKPKGKGKKSYSQNRYIDYSRTINDEHAIPSESLSDRKERANEKRKGYEEKGRVTRSYPNWNRNDAVEEREYHMMSYDVELQLSPTHPVHSQTNITRYPKY